MEYVATLEKSYLEFFSNVKIALRNHPVAGPAKWSALEKEFEAFLVKAKTDVRAALCDDFDTPVRLLHAQALGAFHTRVRIGCDVTQLRAHRLAVLLRCRRCCASSAVL